MNVGSTSLHQLDSVRLRAFVMRCSEGARAIELSVTPLTGGLRSTAVARVQARFLDGQGRRQHMTFVVKRLVGEDQREAAIYQMLMSRSGGISAPRLLGVESVGSAESYLFLERVTPWRRWPWTASAHIELVLDQLARLHVSMAGGALVDVVSAWDYEARLRESAEATLAVLERTAHREGQRELLAVRRPLRRLISALPTIRDRLLSHEESAVVIHGDVHPGNVLVRRRAGREEAVLFDWGFARRGTALEDVGSWLWSLGFWEPEARRRHDTLLRWYCAARGWPSRLEREFRDAYWLATACNVLAGALRYHLLVMSGLGNPSSKSQVQAWSAARACVRVIRRADACWSG